MIVDVEALDDDPTEPLDDLYSRMSQRAQEVRILEYRGNWQRAYRAYLEWGRAEAYRCVGVTRRGKPCSREPLTVISKRPRCRAHARQR